MQKKILTLLVLLITAVTGAWADEVTFSASDLKATLPSDNTNIAVPYEWKESSDQVTVTIAKQDETEATLSVGNTINLTNAYQFTVSVRGAGTLNSIKITTNPTSQAANVTVNNGTYTSPNWTPEGETNSVTFTVTNTFRLSQIAVDYTPDPTPSEPKAPAVTPTENKNEWTFTMPDYAVVAKVEYDTELELLEENVNTTVLADWDGYEADVTMTRTLQAGSWNTFAAPFSTAIPDGWTVKELSSTSFADGTLTLNFATAASIEAGKPYLVKVSANADLSAAPFTGAIVSKDAQPFTSTDVDFIPTLGATTIPDGDTKAVLFLAAGNKLLNPSALPADMKGFRAYFQLKGEAASLARAFSIDFGDGKATGITSIGQLDNLQSDDWYDLSGRKLSNGQLSNRQMKKGVYIQNGKKVIIK